MKRWVGILAVLSLLAGPALAQHQLTQYTTLFSGTGTGDGTTRLDVQSFSSVLIKVRIDSTGTVNFKGSADGLDSTNLAKCELASDSAGTQVASTTSSGDYSCSTANLKEVFVNVSANGSGVVVQAIGSTASAKRGSGGGSGGGSGSVTSVDASGGVETSSGSAITGSGTIRGARCIKHEVGTTYTFLAADRGCVVTFTNANPVAATLPEAGTTGFEGKWFVIPLNLGAGTVTITPTTSTIQGGSDVDLTTGKSIEIVSDDTNYFYSPGIGLTAEAQGFGAVAAINRTYGGAVSQATGIQVGDDASGEYWNLHRNATSGLTFECEMPAGLGQCNKKIKIYTGFVFDFLNDANTSIAKLTESTGAWTNFTLNAEASGNTITIPDEDHWDVAACHNVTAEAVYNLPTANAPTPVCEGTNTRLATLDFDDTTDEKFQGRWKLPVGFNPALGITIHGTWKAVSTTGAVGWCFLMVRVPAGSTSDPALPAQTTGNCVSDTADGTTLGENTFTINNVTCTSCVAGDAVNWSFERDATGGAVTDSMTGDAKLISFGRTWRVDH